MRITIEIDSKSELEKLSALFKTFSTVKVIPSNEASASIIKGNKKINPDGLFRIWAKNPRTIEDIRNTAWKRDQ